MRLIATLFFLAIFCAPQLSEAQNFVPAEVEVSQELIRIQDGSLMYVHKVKKGQTLYSIAKKYQVSTEQILACNRQLPESGEIKAGDIIYIPVETAAKPRKSDTKKGEVRFPSNKKSRTESEGNSEDRSSDAVVESIDRKNNQNFRSSGEQVRYKKHKVKWYENLDEIAEHYGVSVDDIMSLNNLAEKRIKSRMILLIPDRKYADRLSGHTDDILLQDGQDSAIEISGEKDPDADSVFTDSPFSQKKENPALQPARDTEREFKVSIIMPFKIGQNGKYADKNYMDFYSGSLMGIKKMKDEGMHLNVQFFDLAQYGNSVHDIIETGLLEGSSFILGPVMKRNLTGLITYCEQNHIPLISPMDPDAEELARVSPMFIQAVPSTEHIKQQIFDEYARDNDTTFHVMVYERGSSEKGKIRDVIMKAELSGTKIDSLSYGILQGREILGKLKSKLVKGPNVLNKVLVPSENQAFVSDIIRNLNLATLDDYNIEIYGMPNWKNFQNIDVQLYHDMNLNLYVAYYTDYSHADVRKFVKSYKTLYKAEPTPFSFQGYDLTHYFLNLLFYHQNDFTEGFSNETEVLLQSNIRFKEILSGGFVNVGSKHIVYEDNYHIREVR